MSSGFPYSDRFVADDHFTRIHGRTCSQVEVILPSREADYCHLPEQTLGLASLFVELVRYHPPPKLSAAPAGRVIFFQALCQQMLDDWGAKFGAFGIRLAELTSDSTAGPASGSLRDLASADIILTTPEKWDSITRRWKEHAFLVSVSAPSHTMGKPHRVYHNEGLIENYGRDFGT